MTMKIMVLKKLLKTCLNLILISIKYYYELKSKTKNLIINLEILGLTIIMTIIFGKKLKNNISNTYSRRTLCTKFWPSHY